MLRTKPLRVFAVPVSIRRRGGWPVSKACPFATEAEMIACWRADLEKSRQGEKWTVYAETAGWDLLLVHRDGYQLGLEAKLGLNIHVIAQALKGTHSYWQQTGPDYRGVLVPSGCIQHHLTPICGALGLGLLKVHPSERGVWRDLGLPDESSWGTSDWPSWLPERRCELPAYVPDVQAGHPSPIALTHWKVKAIKLMILLDRRGRVTRGDMRALQISPTRFTDRHHGLLVADADAGGYVRHDGTPDLRKQHPTNYAEIEADYDKWCPPGYRFEAAA